MKHEHFLKTVNNYFETGTFFVIQQQNLEKRTIFKAPKQNMKHGFFFENCEQLF